MVLSKFLGMMERASHLAILARAPMRDQRTHVEAGHDLMGDSLLGIDSFLSESILYGFMQLCS